MSYVINYSSWRALYEEAEQAETLGLKISDIWSKISNKIKKRYGKEPNEVLDDAKSALAAAKAGSIDLPEEPLAPEVPADSAAIEPRADVAERLNESIDWEYWIDVAIDVLGGILDGIPLGVTQVASMVVDILHTISYALRWWFSTNENSKIKYLIMSIIGIIAAASPGFGNLMNISILGKLDKILAASPQALTKAAYSIVGKTPSLMHWSNFAKWKIKFVYVFIKIIGNGAQELLESLSSKFNEMFKGLTTYLKAWIKASPMTGWIISDYVMPVINMLSSFTGNIAGMKEIKELAKF